jgi:nucleotide-binding universal stress UspA family protein
MFKTIVLAHDGSEGAQRAADRAVELAREEEASVVIAHVEEDLIGKGGGPIIANEDEIQAELRKLRDELAGEGVDASLEIRQVMLGGPARVIEEIAEEKDADLIVSGRHGHTPLIGAVVGGVTQRLLHVAHRPVLVVPKDQR